MPTLTQKLLDREAVLETIPSPGEPGLSLKRSFPGSPSLPENSETKLTMIKHGSGVTINTDRESYREAYSTHVMSGIINVPGSDFNLVDLDYGTTDGTVPEFQPPNQADAQAAADDNTIASSGLGPNVATLDIDQPDNPGAGKPVVEVSKVGGPAFVGEASAVPFDTSVSISSTGLYGGPTPTGPGDLGKSGAS